MRVIRIIAISICIFTFIEFHPPLLMAQEAAEEKAIGASVLNLLSESGRLIPDVETNSILVIDYPPNIAMIEEFLKMADVQNEQVLIEARVVEVKLENEHALGVNWSLFTKKGGAEIGQFRLGSGAGLGLEQAIPFRKPKWEPLIGEEEEPFTIGIFDENIDIVLKALTTQLKIDILSAPKITTTNNRRAKIDIVKTIPYLEEVEKEEEETETTTKTTYTYSYTYADEGVSLEVTPLINPDRSITITLCPQVKEIVRWHEMVKPDPALEKAPQLPETDIRMAQTKVTVKERQTLVIGGLIREKIKAGVTKVPLLGDIPLLGAFFRSKKDIKEKTELLILVSPTIITQRVVARMEKEEKLGIGKWYMDEREKKSKEFAERLSDKGLKNLAFEEAFSQAKFTQDLDLKLKALEERQKEITQLRKNIEKRIK